MVLRQGNMMRQKPPADVLLFTANAAVTHQGSLVMGGGAALAVRERFPGVDLALGLSVKAIGDPYGVVSIILPDQDLIIGAFQVKHHWLDDALSSLISGSAIILRNLALTEWKDKRISLNFPGIGNGRMRRKDVLPLIECLPDNVTVWEF